MIIYNSDNDCFTEVELYKANYKMHGKSVINNANRYSRPWKTLVLKRKYIVLASESYNENRELQCRKVCPLYENFGDDANVQEQWEFISMVLHLIHPIHLYLTTYIYISITLYTFHESIYTFYFNIWFIHIRWQWCSYRSIYMRVYSLQPPTSIY